MDHQTDPWGEESAEPYAITLDHDVTTNTPPARRIDPRQFERERVTCSEQSWGNHAIPGSVESTTGAFRGCAEITGEGVGWRALEGC